MKRLVWTWLFFLAACASGNRVVTMETFYDIPIGATKEEIIAKTGEPAVIRKLDDGTVEYEYVERMRVGARLMQERHYILVLKDNVIISKRIEQRSPPPQTFDSYQMQTTERSK